MAKTMTCAVLHFTVAFSVTFALTGSWVLGGAIALLEPAINTVAFYFHELAWQHKDDWKQTLSGWLAGIKA